MSDGSGTETDYKLILSGVKEGRLAAVAVPLSNLLGIDLDGAQMLAKAAPIILLDGLTGDQAARAMQNAVSVGESGAEIQVAKGPVGKLKKATWPAASRPRILERVTAPPAVAPIRPQVSVLPEPPVGGEESGTSLNEPLNLPLEEESPAEPLVPLVGPATPTIPSLPGPPPGVTAAAPGYAAAAAPSPGMPSSVPGASPFAGAPLISPSPMQDFVSVAMAMQTPTPLPASIWICPHCGSRFELRALSGPVAVPHPSYAPAMAGPVYPQPGPGAGAPGVPAIPDLAEILRLGAALAGPAGAPPTPVAGVAMPPVYPMAGVLPATMPPPAGPVAGPPVMPVAAAPVPAAVPVAGPPVMPVAAAPVPAAVPVPQVAAAVVPPVAAPVPHAVAPVAVPTAPVAVPAPPPVAPAEPVVAAPPEPAPAAESKGGFLGSLFRRSKKAETADEAPDVETAEPEAVEPVAVEEPAVAPAAPVVLPPPPSVPLPPPPAVPVAPPGLPKAPAAAAAAPHVPPPGMPGNFLIRIDCTLFDDTTLATVAAQVAPLLGMSAEQALQAIRKLGKHKLVLKGLREETARQCAEKLNGIRNGCAECLPMKVG